MHVLTLGHLSLGMGKVLRLGAILELLRLFLIRGHLFCTPSGRLRGTLRLFIVLLTLGIRDFFRGRTPITLLGRNPYTIRTFLFRKSLLLIMITF